MISTRNDTAALVLLLLPCCSSEPDQNDARVHSASVVCGWYRRCVCGLPPRRKPVQCARRHRVRNSLSLACSVVAWLRVFLPFFLCALSWLFPFCAFFWLFCCLFFVGTTNHHGDCTMFTCLVSVFHFLLLVFFFFFFISVLVNLSSSDLQAQAIRALSRRPQ